MITTLYTYIDCRVALPSRSVLYRFAVCSSWWCIVNIKMVIFTDWGEDFFPISLTVFINVFCFHSQFFFALVPFRMIFSLHSCRSMHALSPHLFAAIFQRFFVLSPESIFIFSAFHPRSKLTHLDQLFMVFLWTLNHTHCDNTYGHICTDTLGSVRLSLLVCCIFVNLLPALCLSHPHTDTHAQLLLWAFAFLFHFVFMPFATSRARKDVAIPT